MLGQVNRNGRLRMYAILALIRRYDSLTQLVQRLLCTAPRRYAHSYNEPCPVPCAQVPRKNRAGIPPASGELPNQRHDWTAADRYVERRPEVARRLFVAVFATAAYLTAGRGT